ncbi:MAG: ABC-2 transporter permease [Oscillospiraceae bacterium]|nr:ABC-2 transporter permease [Oscillospiraceae bacterium]
MIAIYKRELKSYFTSMIGYVYLAFMCVVVGIYFMAYNLYQGYPYAAYALYGCNFVYLISMPFLTMRSMAEDRKTKTDQLLLTAPVKVSSVVVGKFLAMASMLAISCLIFCLYPLVIRIFGTSYALAADYNAILTYFLMGCVYIGVGLFISSLCESQIIAVVASFGVCFLLYMWPSLVGFLPTSAYTNLLMLAAVIVIVALIIYALSRNWLLSVILCIGGVGASCIVYRVNSDLFDSLITNALGTFSITDALYDVAVNQVFDLSGILMYLSLIALSIFLTIQCLQRRRWS